MAAEDISKSKNWNTKKNIAMAMAIFLGFFFESIVFMLMDFYLLFFL